MTPAQCVIKAFGGVRKTAKAINRKPGAVIQWRRRGLIPNAVQVKILALAKSGMVHITAEELICGIPEPTHQHSINPT